MVKAVETLSRTVGAFDHVAFYTDDLDSVLARLDAMGQHQLGPEAIAGWAGLSVVHERSKGITIGVTGP